MAREISVRIPFSSDMGAKIQDEAKNMNISYSSYLRMLIDRGRRACIGSELSSLLQYRIAYEKYLVVYVSKDMDEDIKAIAPGMEASKIYSYLTQKGRDVI